MVEQTELRTKIARVWIMTDGKLSRIDNGRVGNCPGMLKLIGGELFGRGFLSGYPQIKTAWTLSASPLGSYDRDL